MPSTHPTTLTKQQVQKFRPVLPAYLITHIIALAKQDVVAGSTSLSSIELISILAPFAAKIENAGITAAYTTAPPKKSLEESLGMSVSTPAPAQELQATATHYMLDGAYFVNKEEYWEACYHKFLNSPSSCTLQELQAAREHKYLEGLMSPEEMVEFEKELFSKNNSLS